tara:strand:- start:2181 stop:3062 length:882 start_codon:yes stop_codon:yes gene_type:complete
LKIILFGSNTYPANFFLKNNNQDFDVTVYKKKFEHTDILYLDNDLFFKKYFLSIYGNFECSLNFIHIHDVLICSEIEINKKLSEKMIFAFNKMQIKKNIYISSVNSYTQAKTEYGKAKLNCEEIYKFLEYFIIIRPSTIIEIDYEKKIIKGGKKGKSFDSLNKIISKFFIIPVPGFGKYSQTVCYGADLAKFIDYIVVNDYFYNKIINFYTGEAISYNRFLDIYFNFKKIKRIKFYVPKIIIITALRLIKMIFQSLDISSKNIDNLSNQKIEFDFTEEIEKIMKLKKINDLNL